MEIILKAFVSGGLRAVTPETVKNEQLSCKVMGSLMKIVAPLM